MNQDLQNYIKEMHEQGFSDENVREELIKAGWTQEMIDTEIKAFGQISSMPPATLEEETPKPEKTLDKKIPKKEPLNKKSKKKLILSISLIGVFLIAGVVFGALYSDIWNPGWDPFVKDTKESVNEKTQAQQDLQEQNKESTPTKNNDLNSIEFDILSLSQDIKMAREQAMPNVAEENKMPLFNKATFNGDYWMFYWQSTSFRDHFEFDSENQSPLYRYQAKGDLVQYTPRTGVKDFSKIFYSQNLIITNIINSGDWWIIKTISKDNTIKLFYFDGKNIVEYDNFQKIVEDIGNYVFINDLNGDGMFLVYTKTETEDFVQTKSYYVFDRESIRDVTETFITALDKGYYSASSFRLGSEIVKYIERELGDFETPYRAAFFDGNSLEIRNFSFIDPITGESIEQPYSINNDISNAFSKGPVCAEKLCYSQARKEWSYPNIYEFNFDTMEIRVFPLVYILNGEVQEDKESGLSKTTIISNIKEFLFVHDELLLSEVTEEVYWENRLVLFNQTNKDLFSEKIYKETGRRIRHNTVVWNPNLNGWFFVTKTEDEPSVVPYINFVNNEGTLIENIVDIASIKSIDTYFAGKSYENYILFAHPNPDVNSYFYVPTEEFVIYDLRLK